MMLARMSGDLPVAIGVIRNVKKTSYTQLYEDQMEEQMANGKYKYVDALLNSATKGKKPQSANQKKRYICVQITKV
jgi:hypothetical protein